MSVQENTQVIVKELLLHCTLPKADRSPRHTDHHVPRLQSQQPHPTHHRHIIHGGSGHGPRGRRERRAARVGDECERAARRVRGVLLHQLCKGGGQVQGSQQDSSSSENVPVGWRFSE